MRLAAENISKNFMRNRRDSNILCAVAETDLVLEGNTLSALSGPSGSGKSTLLNMLAGLLPPTSGRVLLDHTDLYALEDKELSQIRNRHIGVIPQGQTALQSLNVLENVMVPFALYQKMNTQTGEQMQKRAEELLEQAGILDLCKEMPSELSGGEVRRMAVCRAMLLHPEIILADEPTGDLDEDNTRIVMTLLRCHADQGGTVLVVTHDKQVWDYADQRWEMKKSIICKN